MSVRVLSGVRATGDLHIGNYLGAVRQWVAGQDDVDAYYFIADLHGLTDVTAGFSPGEFRDQRLKTAATFLACGLEPSKVTLFFQSDVPQHTELLWFLAAVARKGELERMTQWKDKAGANQAGASAALFTYPVLMASDILLYDADEVPVGDDQRQHVEVTRDWAIRFNQLFGPTFTVPAATVPSEGARVMDLQNPSKKMSKSADGSGAIFLDDTPETIVAKVRKAVTDAGPSVRCGRDRPGITNLIHIYAAITRQDPAEVESEFSTSNYKTFKSEVADAVVAELAPVRSALLHLLDDRGQLEATLREGSDQAASVAVKTCDRVREALGLRGAN